MKYVIGFMVYWSASVCMADFITFSAEVNSGGSPKIVIDNRSDADWQMVRAVFNFSGTPVVIGTPSALSFGTYGTYQTANTAGGAASLVTLSHSASWMQFDFSGMTSGDGYGVAVGIGDVRGSQMNGATIEALFRNVQTSEERSLKHVYDVSGSGRSFPAFASASVPEPGSAGIGAAFLVAIASRFRRQLTRRTC